MLDFNDVGKCVTETMRAEKAEIDELFLARHLCKKDCLAIAGGQCIGELPSVQYARQELAAVTAKLRMVCGDVDGLGQDFRRVDCTQLKHTSAHVSIGWTVDHMLWIGWHQGMLIDLKDGHKYYDYSPAWINASGYFMDYGPEDVLTRLILNQDKAQELADGVANSGPHLLATTCRYLAAAGAKVDAEKIYRLFDPDGGWQLEGIDSLVMMTGRKLRQEDLDRIVSAAVDILADLYYPYYPWEARQFVWHLLAAGADPWVLLYKMWHTAQNEHKSNEEALHRIREGLKFSMDLFAACREEDLYSILDS